MDCGGLCRWLRCVSCRARRTAAVAQKRQYHATNKVQVAATQRRWHERNKPHVHALQRAWRARNRDRLRLDGESRCLTAAGIG